jgi:hypothetical protein
MEITATPTNPALGAKIGEGGRGFLFRMLRGKRREVLFWILCGLYWAVIGLIGLLIAGTYKVGLPDVEMTLLVRVTTGFALTLGLRVLFLQPWFRRGRGMAKWALAAGFCLLLAMLELFVLQALLRTGIAVPGGVETTGVKLLVVRIFTLGVWSALYFAVHLVEDEHILELRATRAELAAKDFELRHLQAQMNPHFVFHALDGVLACKDDPEAVEKVTRSLSDYLGFLLAETRPLVPLGRELEALERFLSVQTSLSRKNLVCRINWDPSARTVMVPPMTVQPLVENAFLHRPGADDLPLQIWLTAVVESGFLRITLSNTGEPKSSDGLTRAGDGIDALRKRLALLLGPDARVEQENDNGWIRVSVIIPVNGNTAGSRA